MINYYSSNVVFVYLHIFKLCVPFTPESASFTSIQNWLLNYALVALWGDKTLDESVSWGWPYSELNGWKSCYIQNMVIFESYCLYSSWWSLLDCSEICEKGRIAGADSVPLPLVFSCKQQGRMDCAWTVWNPQIASWYRRSWWVGCVWNCGIPIH